MKYLCSYVTTAGAVRKVNQDSLFIISAEYQENEIIFAGVCDGVGGLSAGETASSYVCKRLTEWFSTTLADMLKSSSSVLEIRSSLDEKLHELNDRINAYADANSMDMATTCTALLIIPSLGKMLVAHVGDTRLYRITNENVTLLTSDHSVVGKEVREGRLTEEMAEKDKRQNQLTNCIGAGMDDTSYDYSITDYSIGDCYMLCSDGFRKKLKPDDIAKTLAPSANNDEDVMKANLEMLRDKVLSLGEKDNISALMIKLN